MPGFNGIREVVDAQESGASTIATWRKSPSQITTSGFWFDLSMSPGNPVPQYYANSPLVSVAFRQSTDGGIYHGAAVSPAKKAVRETMVMATTVTALPMPMILCDYLLFYPFVDDGTTDEQPMNNAATLPRSVTGEGVKIMAVTVAGRTGGQFFTVNYTNSKGVPDRTSQIVRQNAIAGIGTILTSHTNSNGAVGPFIPLQVGDTGVRSIQSVTMLGTDVGLFALVLIKPITQIQLRGIDAPVENDHFLDKATFPVIEDDAYLNFLCLPQGSLSSTALHGTLTTAWN